MKNLIPVTKKYLYPNQKKLSIILNKLMIILSMKQNKIIQIKLKLIAIKI